MRDGRAPRAEYKDWPRRLTRRVKTKARWIIGGAIIATLVAACGWLVLTDAPAYQFLVRLYVDKRFLKHTLREWGVLAPVIFIGLQALQVIIAPIPGELTGILGGYLFGQWGGLLYSMIGLTLGSVGAFAVGRWLGARYVQKLVSPDIWRKLGFIVEAEGAIVCFIIFLIPGLPKDIVCYLFGLSPIPFWVFAIVSSLGRVPGTLVLSAQGAKTASGHYLEVAVLTAVVAAVAPPPYQYRPRLVAWMEGRTQADDETPRSGEAPGPGTCDRGPDHVQSAPLSSWVASSH